MKPTDALDAFGRGTLYGMSLAMRVCRNRRKDLGHIMSGSDAQTNRLNEIETCIGVIRIVQVEIGAGRMSMPKLTTEEQEEIDRIS